MTDHDTTYKLLFSHRQMIQSLLQGFVGEDWVGGLDFSTLEKVPVSFITDDHRNRHGDLAWRVRGRTHWLYVYLLLEFQSRVDPHMALRMMSYLALFYQDLVRQRGVQAGAPLPPVLPMVLYNGGPRWQAAQDVADLIAAPPGGLARYRPGLRYFLIDQGQLAQSDAQPLRNLAAAFFQLERSRAPEDIGRALDALIECTALPEFAALRGDLVRWLQHSLLPARMPGVRIPRLHDIQEARIMLYDTVKGWTEEWKQEGLRLGIEQGIQQGTTRRATRHATRPPRAARASAGPPLRPAFAGTAPSHGARLAR